MGAMPADAEAPGRASTRDRILEASTELFSRQGYSGTGLKAILAMSNAPYGSLYHHFPGGKEELGAAAITLAGTGYRDLVAAIFAPDIDVVTATSNFAEGAAAVLELTDFADACPIATIALEISSTSEPMRRAAAAAFESWLAVLTDRFHDVGIGAPRARELAIELFCAVEGAFILCRATRDATPMRTIGRAQAASVAAALPHRVPR